MHSRHLNKKIVIQLVCKQFATLRLEETKWVPTSITRGNKCFAVSAETCHHSEFSSHSHVALSRFNTVALDHPSNETLFAPLSYTNRNLIRTLLLPFFPSA